mmetsp:Transcript_50702/g.163980  ORF Transcript_50702/g.163980 Transcript_50702/m.163980 type:complete len:292 (+) Transcript_50702:529-1404(+)
MMRRVSRYIAAETGAISSILARCATLTLSKGCVSPSPNVRPQFTRGGSNEAARVTPASAPEMPLLCPRATSTPDMQAMIALVTKHGAAGGPRLIICGLFIEKRTQIPLPSPMPDSMSFALPKAPSAQPPRNPTPRAKKAPHNAFLKPRLTSDRSPITQPQVKVMTIVISGDTKKDAKMLTGESPKRPMAATTLAMHTSSTWSNVKWLAARMLLWISSVERRSLELTALKKPPILSLRSRGTKSVLKMTSKTSNVVKAFACNTLMTRFRFVGNTLNSTCALSRRSKCSPLAT